MKFNWGFGIVLSFVAFIAFILYFVVKISMDDSSHHLVTKGYYQKELAYQDQIDAQQNAKELKDQVIVQKQSTGLLISLPKDFEGQAITGNISLYRPSNEILDFEVPLQGMETRVVDKNLLEGRWDVSVQWEHQGKTYLYIEKITY